MRVLGVQFAPLNLPLKRRMETAAVLFITASFFVGGLFWTVVYAYLLFCTRFYWLALIYAAWYVYDWRTPKLGGRSSTRVRSWWIWNNIREYFPARLIKTADLDPGRNYILGYHPHGIMCMGAIANFVSKTSGGGLLFPGIRICALSLNLNFLFPFHREFMLWYGMCSADRESLQYILTKKGTGNAVLIAIGGAQESLDAHKDSSVITLTLMKRKGFVRNAIKCGTDLVPVFSFGENDIFRQLKNPPGSTLRRLQEKLKSIAGFSPPIFYGRGIFQYTWGYMPFRNKITTVVGKPIRVDKKEDPTEEEVDQLHEEYVASLRQLFENHKEQCGFKERTLRIV
ncbi:2-acylglycerol O-acyltransferase 2-like isoform X1 [Haemaphysalis longicornis]